MHKNTVIGIAWIVTAIAVSTGVWITESPTAIFGFIFPALITKFPS